MKKNTWILLLLMVPCFLISAEGKRVIVSSEVAECGAEFSPEECEELEEEVEIVFDDNDADDEDDEDEDD